MATDQLQSPEKPYRPLPSVDIPLLREERRANRSRRILALTLGISVCFLLVAGLIAFLKLGPDLFSDDGHQESQAVVPTFVAPTFEIGIPDAGTASRSSQAEIQATGVAITPASENVAASTPQDAAASANPSGDPGASREHLFGGARSFRDALYAAGISRAEAQELITGLERVMDFRRCRPTDRMVVTRSADGQLTKFAYHASITEIYEAERLASGRYRGSRARVPIERVRLVRGGVVRTSLGDALASLGLGRALVGSFIEAFDGRVPFATATRDGDTFRLIVEEERVNGQFLRYGTVHGLEYQSQRLGEQKAYFFEDRPGSGDFFDPTGRAVHGGWIRAPLRYDHISSGFNPRRLHPILRRVVPHQGIDYTASSGTPVWAAADGVVTFAGEKGANGNLVAIRHAGGYETFYAHLSRIGRGITRGTTVHQRDVIGAVGSTGRSTGPHLHFGLKKNGRFIDPARELNGPGRPLPASLMPRFRRHMASIDAELRRVTLPSIPRPTNGNGRTADGTHTVPDGEPQGEEAFD